MLRILHADDDDSFHLVVRRALAVEKLEGRCTVHVVSDGGEAVEYVAGIGKCGNRELFPQAHLVLVEQRMRAMDGIDALKRMRQDKWGKRLPVILFSTAATESLVDGCFAAGGTLCIEKPMDF